MNRSLDVLILDFELPLPDEKFPDLFACLGGEARRRAAAPITTDSNACYAYLLARVYELLGYCARHTPWLSNSDKFYWQKAIGFYEQARDCTESGSAQHSFLHAKAQLRKAMNYVPKEKHRTARGPEQDLLAQAETAFSDAASKEPDRSRSFIYKDAAAIANTEARQLTLREEIRKMMKQATLVAWLDSFETVWEKARSFTADAFGDLPSLGNMDWPAQHALAEARKLFAEAHMLDELLGELSKAPKEYAEAIQSRREESERRILECYEQSAVICLEAGLTVRAAHTRVLKLRRSAFASLKDCVYQFKVARNDDAAERLSLLAQAEIFSYELPASIGPALQGVSDNGKSVRISLDLMNPLRNAGLEVTDDFTVFNDFGRHWLVTDGFDRYLIQKEAEHFRAVDLAKQPIPFDHMEGQRFSDYAERIKGTCKLFADAIREIDRALREAADLYKRLASHLQTDMDKVRDPDLRSLFVTTSRIRQEFESRHYPILSTLRDRTLYAWSLLEMFQMRNGAVRLGTLFSAQCHLIMRNPFYEKPNDDTSQNPDDEPSDEFLEVGADPIFRTTIDFVFRGAKGEEGRHEFQGRALKATLDTIEQQEASLLSETRYVEMPTDTRRALVARLRCHRNLALALKEFTPVFIAPPLDMATSEIEHHLDEISKHMNEARTSLEQAAEQRSKLIDQNGLDALHSYMKAIGRVLIGMNQRQTPNSSWWRTYVLAIDQLHDTTRCLKSAGHVYLLPAGNKRTEYLDYVEARLMTVCGYQAWYRAQDSSSPADYAKAADFFDRATAIYRETLRDYRLATKAEARAMEARTDSVQEVDTAARARRYAFLREANAIYAACGDSLGFDRTWSRLEREFAFEEARRVPAAKKSLSSGIRHTVPVAPSVPQSLASFGDYEIEPIDEAGGMGMVFRAWKDGHLVALKRIRDEYVDRSDFLQRFLKEIAIIKALRHPNIIDIFDSGDVEGVPFFTMEFLDGQTLDKVLTEKGRMDAKRSAKIIWQIVAALDYAHSKGVIHRDLKPSNVMLLVRDHIKVLDFGVASSRQFGTLTPLGEFVGTYEYAAPEHIRTGRADEKSDVYALGLIFYELLTGRPGLTWRKRMDGNHPSVLDAAPDVPPPLAALVSSMLKLDVKERTSPQEVINRLRTYLGPDAAK